MSKPIEVSSKGGQLTDHSRELIRERVEEFQRAARRLKVFRVVVDLQDVAAPAVEIKAWETNDPDGFNPGSFQPNIHVVNSGQNVVAAIGAAFANAQQQLERDRPVGAKESLLSKAVASPFLWSGIIALALLTVFVWFGMGGGPEIVPVNGVVTFDDKPLANAQIVFHSAEGRNPAVAITDASGKFSLSTTGSGDGAYPGNYTVTVMVQPINKIETTPVEVDLDKHIAEELELSERLEAGTAPTLEYPIPTAYLNVASSPIKVTVPHPGLLELKLNKDGRFN